MLLTLFGFLGMTPLAVQAAATTYFVTATGGDTSCAAANPCSMARAVSLAIDGDEIRVASGTYDRVGSDPVLNVTESLTVTGGYLYNSGTGSWSSTADPGNITILDGEDNGRVVEIAAGTSPIIENFHVQNGVAQDGAGIYIEDGDGRAIIRYNAIHHNTATGSTLGGGGIYDGGGSTIAYNDIYSNTTASNGAGVFLHNDSATISSTIAFNNIYVNEASGGSPSFGGGIFMFFNANGHFVGNKIHGNSADIGGGLGVSGAQFSMHSNLMYLNEAVNGDTPAAVGGAIWSSGNGVIWNNTVASNTAIGAGAGLHLENGTVEIHNTIIALNTSPGNNGLNNDDSAPATIFGTFNLLSDTIDTSGVSFTNDVSGDPAFVNVAGQNYHITSGSAARNTGSTSTPGDVDIDIDGQPRPNPDDLSLQDVGSDEYYADFREVSIEPTTDSNYVEKGTTAVFTHTIRNEGSLNDTYAISCVNSAWSIGSCASPIGPLAPGETERFTTQVLVPGSAAAYDDTFTTITATSQADSAVFARAVVHSTVAPHPDVSFTPNYTRTELPGAVITLTHVLTNTGDAFENFIVTIDYDPGEWGELIPSEPLTIGLNSGQFQNVQVQIQVPAYADAGFENIVQLKATSEFSPTIFDTAVNTITAKATIGTRYVRLGADDTDNNCTQSSKPCGSIDHAVGQAASGDEIRIAPGEYNENSLEINDVFYISGGWANFKDSGQGDEPDPSLTIINAGSGGPAFIINTAQSEISVLTMRNGSNGNGGAAYIASSAEPKFYNVIFSGNQAATRGGALYINSGAAVSIDKSFFISNTAAVDGGAIHMTGGTLSIRQTRFLTNTANNNNGGAFAMLNGSFTGQNNLFHNNEALSGDGGAVAVSGGTAVFNFNTWVDNNASGDGGGVFNNGATFTVTNSIFSENDDGSGNAIFGDSGSTWLDYLAMWQNSSNVSVGPNSFTGNPLFADEMFRLGLGSPAIDTADPASTLTIDFEDDDRPSDEGHDIGYDERSGCRTRRDGITYGSIQAAVDVDSSDDTILVSGICRGVHTIEYESQTISQTVHLTKSLIIQGGWNSDFSRRFEEVTQVDPEGRGRAFFISDGVNVTIETISVTNGSAAGLGGGPAGEDAGGGFYNVDGQVTLRGVKVITGTADLGGGFYNDAGNPLLTWLYIERDPNNDNEESYVLTELTQGTAVSGGGGVYNNTGELTVDGAWFHHNQADNGGGLYNFSGPITVTNAIFDNNTADNGAALYNEAATSNYLHLTVYGNIASSNGGGFYNAAGQPVIYSSIFESNQAIGDGSAIYDAVAGTGSDPDYNYYYNNSGIAVVGTVSGTHSIISLQPPGLTDPGLGDFHLVDDALAADVADPLSPIATDFEDEPRPSNQGFDMGADETVGCLVQMGGEVYGSLQAAINAAEPGMVIKVSGDCSGVHQFSSGSGSACGGTMQTAVHITKELTLLGGWDEDFNNQIEDTYSVLDAKTQGRVMYIGQGVSVTVESFAIINGVADNGAGICIDDSAQPSLRNNRIYSNTASADGAGIYSLNSPTLLEDGNHIYHNEADSNGGGLYLTGSNIVTATVQNNFIYNNTADTGAGIHNASGDHIYWHNTLYGNSATSTGGGFEIPDGSPDIRGNIMMENQASSGSGALNATTSGSPTIDYNDYYQNDPIHAALQPGDISVDPDFANIISGVFTITIDSPVVDIEIPDMPLMKDFEGDMRPSQQAYDLGADEVGGCFAAIYGQENIVYGSVQQAVETAVAGDTVLVDGICQNVNRRLVNGNLISQTVLITQNLIIDGSWDHPDDTSTVTTTLQANDKGRVVYVNTGATVTITNIILRAGDATAAGDTNDNGGGIYNNGTLAFVTAWVQENTAVSGGGIFNEGILTIDNSYVLTNTVTQNGSGLYNNDSATVQDSTIRGNSADNNGGGIYQQAGTLLVDKNRISANSADSNGAGLYLNSGGSIEVRNNFIYNNNANTGGGLYNANTGANIWHNTLFNNTAQSNNGAGIANAGGDPDIRNNIIDRNNGSGFYASSGSPDADYNNVIGNSWGNYDPASLEGSYDISQQPDYQAPTQGNFHLLQGSPGEDVGDLTVPVPEDIDGDQRPTNGGPDMGADEINSCLIRVGGEGGEIFGVLQNAIDYAYSVNETSIDIARGECRGVKYNATSDTWQVGYLTATLNFIGSLRRSDFVNPSPSDYYNPDIRRLTTMINADDEGHVLYIANGAAPTFYQIAFVDGNAAVGGGTHGGAIHKAGAGLVDFKLNYFCDSTAQNGGGIYINPLGSMNISGVRIGDCYVKQLTEDEDGNVDESKTRTIAFGGNDASSNGGGFYTDGNMSARNVGVFENTAGANGGGGYTNQAGNELINVVFYDNIAAGTGGGLYNAGSNVTVLHNTIHTNVAADGGGIYNSGSNFNLNSSIVYTNTAVVGIGGGISSTINAPLNFNNFYENSPEDRPFLTDPNAIVGEPGLLGTLSLSVHSINIDSADPDLLLLPNPIDYDYQLDDRPDGDSFLNYQGDHGIFSDVGADEYYKDFGCEIASSDNARTAAPGDTVTYTLTIVNTGNPSYLNLEWPWDSNGYTDTLTVTLSSQTQGWSSLEGGDEQSIVLGWDDLWLGDGTERVLTVIVPDGIQAGTSEVTTVECQSQSLPNRSDTATITTNVGETGGVIVIPDYIDTAVPGEVRVYTQTVINLQNQQATYLLTAKSGLQHASATLLNSDTMLPVSNITVTLQPTGTVTGGYTETVYLQVRILETAIAGDIANPGLVATDISSAQFNSSNNRTTILAAPATRYVAGGSGTNTTNCADPLQPCATIQYAIEQAYDENGNIDEIKVAAFTYTDYTTRTVGTDTVEQVLYINKSVSISGGYTTTEQVPFTTQTPITNAVKLNGQYARRVIYITDGITPTLSSLFIENGNAAPFNSITGTFGSGIYNAGATLTIYSSWIQNNTGAYGSGIFHEDGLLTLYSSILSYNRNHDGEDGEGGGLYIAAGTGMIENNTFANNAANWEDSPSSRISNAPAAAATGFGGGIFLDDSAAATVTNNIFSNNGAAQGTAIYISSTATIDNNYNLYNQLGSASIIEGGSLDPVVILDDPQFVGFNDYHIQSSSPARDVGTPTVSISQSVDIDLEDRIMGIQIDIGADEWTQRPGLVFVPTPLSATIDSGAVVTYNHWLTNTGNFTDSYALTVDHQVTPAGDATWAYHLEPTSITDLPESTGVQVTLVVTGGQPGYVDVTTITATAVSMLSASVQDTTIISHTAGVDIEASESSIGLPGELVTYTHTLTNTGDGLDEFTLTATAVPTTWITTLTPTLPFYVAAGETTPFTVTVLIPADAISGTQHQLEVTATATDPDASDTLTDTTTVGLVSGLTLVPDYTRPVPDGTSTIYTHTLTNGSSIADTIMLTATGDLPGWLVTIEPESVVLNPTESEIISVTVTVPLDTGGLTHVTQVTATSSLPGVMATATDTTTVPVDTGILFTPNLTESVSAGDTAYYTHTLTNLGNLTDTFDLTNNSEQGWLQSITAGPLTVGLGASVPVTAVISVPPGTPVGIVDSLRITATSQADTAMTGTVTDTTRVIQYVNLTFIPDHDEIGDPGTIEVYTHTLTNNGDGEDTFNLAYSGVPFWTVTLEPATAITLALGETAVVTANLTIPSGASGLTNITTITATSTVNPAVSATVVNTTTVTGDPASLGILIEPDRAAIGSLNETITYYHTVTNTGNVADDVGISVSSAWTAMVTPTQIIGLPDGASAPVTVTVTIPGTALPGEEDLAVVTAVSQSDSAYSSSVTDTTRIEQNHGLLFYPDNVATTAPNTTVVYTHTLHNTGDGADTFAITPDSEHGWTTAVESPITLGGNMSTTIYITLTVPAGTESEVDVMLVTATSTISPSYSAMVSNTTTVTGEPPDGGVDIEPDHMGYGRVGDPIQYVHVVTNTGNAPDTFDITVDSSLGWTPTIEPQPPVLNLDAGETGLVTVTIIIPASGLGAQDVTTVTVTSQTTSSVTDFAVDTTYAPAIFLPIILKPDVIINPTPTSTPTATPTVCAPTGRDLVVTEIRVEPATPAAGVPATVYVTIRNQGSVDVAFGNNFYTDFYVDREPARYLRGNIIWGIQGTWMGAGESRTLSGSYTFSGGSHQLWAQVDTDDTVIECPFENNNVRGPIPLSVSGTNNVIEQEDALQQAEPNDAPRHTPTPENKAHVPDTDVTPDTDVAPTATAVPSSTPTVTPPPSGED